MRSRLRNAVVAGAAVATTLAGTAPAFATNGVLSFDGEVYIDCFGCDVTTGRADLRLTGLIGAVPLLRATAAAEFVADQPRGDLNCMHTGSATGSVNGPVDLEFNWTRIGMFAVISTTGDINGAGTAALTVVDPIGVVPCGGFVRAVVVGGVIGL